MCFSAEASFFSAVVLSVMGVYCLTCVRTLNQLPLALLPFFFAVHQTMEGIIWLYLHHQGVSYVSYENALIAQRFYFFFAYLFFPLYFPFIAWNWEGPSPRRKWIFLLGVVGAYVALAHAPMLGIPDVVAQQVGRHIQYPLTGPETGIPYVCAVCLPCLFCRDRRFWLVGILGIIAFFAALLITYWTLASVWCFFGAWISMLSGWILSKRSEVGKE